MKKFTDGFPDLSGIYEIYDKNDVKVRWRLAFDGKQWYHGGPTSRGWYTSSDYLRTASVVRPEEYKYWKWGNRLEGLDLSGKFPELAHYDARGLVPYLLFQPELL